MSMIQLTSMLSLCERDKSITILECVKSSKSQKTVESDRLLCAVRSNRFTGLWCSTDGTPEIWANLPKPTNYTLYSRSTFHSGINTTNSMPEHESITHPTPIGSSMHSFVGTYLVGHDHGRSSVDAQDGNKRL